MSRTYRKTKLNRSTRKFYDKYSRHTFNYIIRENLIYIKIPMDINSDEYKLEINKFHRDKDISRNKEPGPSYFRNLTSERPLRRKHKLELYKYKLDNTYELNIVSKGKLQYWT